MNPCIECGGSILNRRRDAKYCSTKCQSKATRRRHKDAAAEYHKNWYAEKRFSKYGMTKADYEEMLDAQDNKCLLCGTSFEEVANHIDHCHENGHVRGILCVDCNLGLGRFKDNPDTLLNAYAYIMRQKVVGF